MSEDVRRVRLTGRAARFVGVLQEFGHLDEERTNELFLVLAEHVGAATEVPVDLPIVRSIAAQVLFNDATGGARDLDEGILAEDWPLLFS